MPNDKFAVVGTNIAEKATMIWNVADMLRGPFKPHEYGLVILPMTVVKRFHDCLLPTHDAVLETYEKVKHFAVKDGFLTKASGYQFYNISKFTFDSLLTDPENIEANFRDYLAGFSANVQDVLSKFDFDTVIRRMVESNTLYLVIREFNSPKGYLGPDRITAVDCGYIFEDLVRRFSESFGEEAGAHFTSRDVVYLMTDLLLSDADLSRGGNVTVYDMAMGTSQMLSCMEERIHELNAEIGVTCFGQEFNPSTFAIAKADMMIRGGDPNNMRLLASTGSGSRRRWRPRTPRASWAALRPVCPRSPTDSSSLCSTVWPSLPTAVRWRSFKTARPCSPATRAAAPVRSAAISSRTTGWTPSCK